MVNLVQYWLRRNTSAYWEDKNPILNDGQLALATDTNDFRVGDGIHPWSELDPITGSAGPEGPPGPPGVSGDAFFLTPESFSPAAGDADNLTALQAAADALDSEGGGILQIPKYRRYGWDGELVLPPGVMLQGTTKEVDCGQGLLALSTDSKIRVGEWAGDASRAGGIRDLLIDGNGFGDATGLVHFQSVLAQMWNSSVIDAAGHAVLLDAAQNANIFACFVRGAGDAALAIKNGAGGYNFLGSHFTSSIRDLLIFDDDGSTGNAYPFGSAHLNFWGGIFESYANGQKIADLRATGGGVKFWGTGFSSNGAVTMSDGCIVEVSNPDFPSVSSYVEFCGCNFNGGDNLYDLVRVNGNQRVTFSGQNYIQKSTKPINITNGSPRVQVFGDWDTGGSLGSPIVQATAPGSVVSVYNDRRVSDNFKLPTDRTTALSASRLADAGHRWFMDCDGKMNWNEGGDFGISHYIAHDTTNDQMTHTSLGLAGRFQRYQGSLIFANGAVTVDSKAQNAYQYILNGSGNITSMTITNPVSGAELRISIYAANALVPVLATNIQYMNDRKLEVLNGFWSHIDLKYDASSSVWLETGRSEAVLSTGSTGNGGDPRRRPTNVQTGASYTPVMADRGKWVELTNAGAITLNIPTNASVAFPIDTELDFSAEGAGQVTITPAGGVTINSRGARLKSNGQYAVFGLRKKGTNTWIAYGDLTT